MARSDPGYDGALRKMSSAGKRQTCSQDHLDKLKSDKDPEEESQGKGESSLRASVLS